MVSKLIIECIATGWEFMTFHFAKKNMNNATETTTTTTK